MGATFDRVRAKVGVEGAAVVMPAAEGAITVGCVALQTGGGTGWQLETNLDPGVSIEVINSRHALPGAGNDNLRFSHLQYVVNTAVGKDIAAANRAFWRRKMEDPDAFPPKLWIILLQVSLAALGEKCRPVCVCLAMRPVLEAGAAMKWRPNLWRANLSERQFGLGIPGRVEHVGLRARMR